MTRYRRFILQYTQNRKHTTSSTGTHTSQKQNLRPPTQTSRRIPRPQIDVLPFVDKPHLPISSHPQAPMLYNNLVFMIQLSKTRLSNASSPEGQELLERHRHSPNVHFRMEKIMENECSLNFWQAGFREIRIKLAYDAVPSLYLPFFHF